MLLDFGAARRAVAEVSRSLTGIVKAGYSPQEQYATDGRLQGPWSDLYALGATLYRAVTGKRPEEATLRVGRRSARHRRRRRRGPISAGLPRRRRCLPQGGSPDRPQSVARAAGRCWRARRQHRQSTAARLERALSYMGETRNALWLPWWLGWLDVAKGKRLRSALAVALAFILVMGGYSAVEYVGRLAEERGAAEVG